MVKQTFSISFEFLLERSILIHLMADVELCNSEPYYLITHFRTQGLRGDTMLPTLKIKRKEGRWVHLDTEKESHLSEAVGAGIDRYESDHPIF
ncbi:MAG: hypothetical protein Q8927_19830 [Bacteroidota bacterium]|nr:hypothetical protein [Bacteroidota bacterium]